MTLAASAPFLIFGHRGAPRLARENTLESVQCALDAGADGVEVDVRSLSGDVQVLHHDASVGGRRVEDHTLAELSQSFTSLTLLADVLALCGARECLLIIEVKEEGWEQALAKAVGRRANVIISSFRSAVLRELREIDGAFMLGLVTDGNTPSVFETVAELRLQFLFPHLSLVDDSLVRRASDFSLRVVPWTANRDVDWNRMRALGCAGVITDVPDLAVAWRRRSLS